MPDVISLLVHGRFSDWIAGIIPGKKGIFPTIIFTAKIPLERMKAREFGLDVGDGSKPDFLPVQNRTVC
jgi:hypothetical protein